MEYDSQGKKLELVPLVRVHFLEILKSVTRKISPTQSLKNPWRIIMKKKSIENYFLSAILLSPCILFILINIYIKVSVPQNIKTRKSNILIGLNASKEKVVSNLELQVSDQSKRIN